MKNQERFLIRGSTKCIICRNGANAASEYEFFVKPFDEWVCESHCAEMQIASYSDTRLRFSELVGYSGDDADIISALKGV